MSVIRSAPTALVSFLASLPAGWKAQADLFHFTLADGVTNYYWTSFDSDLVYSGQTYASKNPWLSRSKWSLANTMQVPSLEIFLDAKTGAFGSAGIPIQQQIHNGLFDGATFLLTRVFMEAPGNTTALGGVAIFGGVVGECTITDARVTITIKGKNNLLDQMAPRRVYQTTCNHTFCDVNCTLSASSYTSSFSVGSSPTASFIPWSSGAAPSTPTVYNNGQILFTSGANAGEGRPIAIATSSGIYLGYPLFNVPAPGDAFNAIQGCNKKYASDGSGQSCSDRSNTQHYDAFDFVPNPDTSY